MWKLRRYLRPHIGKFLIASFAKLVEAFMELTLPVFMARIIDLGLSGGAGRDFVIQTGIQMVVVILVGFGAATACQYIAANVSQGVAKTMRDDLIDKISVFSYNEIDKFGTATLINRLTNDVNQVHFAIAMLMRLVTRAPFICIGALVMAIYIDPLLSLIFVLSLPVFVFVTYKIMKKTTPLYKLAQKKLDGLALILRETLSGVRVIRAFAKHNYEKERIDKSTDELSKSLIHVSNVSALTEPLTYVIMDLGMIAILYFGGIRVNSAHLSQGEVLALTNYLAQIIFALIIVSNLVVVFTKAAASAARVNEVFEAELTVTEPIMPVPIVPSEDDVILEFNDVSFSYVSGEDVLTDISFKIKRGDTIGITGTTGSGKSSLINLIPRFYDPNTGSVKLYNINVKDCEKKSVRDKIGIVPQKSILFSGTIADNIRLGNKNATDEEIIRALEISQSYEFVCALEDGINTLIHEGGKNFSGGEKQRLTIARALVRQPEILILDDSLSALDYRTDINLRTALRENLKGTTLIIVSQRISSVMNAKKVLVLSNGCLVGTGTHPELLESCEEYREIYNSQQH